MLKCLDCGQVFEEPMHLMEDHGEFRDVCPQCGSDFEEAEQCNMCKQWFNSDDNFSYGWCMKCAMEELSIDRCREWLDWSGNEIDFINKTYKGMSNIYGYPARVANLLLSDATNKEYENYVAENSHSWREWLAYRQISDSNVSIHDVLTSTE